MERERRRIRLPSPRRTPEDTLAIMREVERRYRSGMAHVDIARELGISVPYSSYLCRKAGLGVADGIRPRIASSRATEREATKNQVVAMYDSGLTHAEIALALGIHKVTSGVICRAAGRTRKVGPRSRKRRS